MHEILFRGKRKDNGEWIEGSLILTTAVCQKAYIVDSCWCEHGKVTEEGFADFNWLNAFEVFPETVGQYTGGLTDKNGKRIFAGDIVKNNWCFLLGYSAVKFGQYKSFGMSNDYQQGHLGFYLEHIHVVDKKTVRKDIMYFANKCEVIGNIHDNPDLLKGGE